LAFGAGVAGNSKVGHHVVEELRNIHPRIEDEGSWHLLSAQPFEQFIDQRGLTRPHLTGQQYKAFAALNAVGQASKRLLRVPREEQLARIRIDVERVGPK